MKLASDQKNELPQQEERAKMKAVPLHLSHHFASPPSTSRPQEAKEQFLYLSLFCAVSSTVLHVVHIFVQRQRVNACSYLPFKLTRTSNIPRGSQ